VKTRSPDSSLWAIPPEKLGAKALNLDRREQRLITFGFLKQAITAFNTTEPQAREI
jgi:hypothetical protein